MRKRITGFLHPVCTYRNGCRNVNKRCCNISAKYCDHYEEDD